MNAMQHTCATTASLSHSVTFMCVFAKADRAEQVRKQKELLMKKMEEMQRTVFLSEKLQSEVVPALLIVDTKT